MHASPRQSTCPRQLRANASSTQRVRERNSGAGRGRGGGGGEGWIGWIGADRTSGAAAFRFSWALEGTCQVKVG
eukprot:1843233-Pleurochrysis_carterae.AAC.1